MKTTTKQRCCPKCGGTEFECADCSGTRERLSGYTMYCLSCGWSGFKLQLAPKAGVQTAAEAAKKINEEAEKELNK